MNKFSLYSEAKTIIDLALAEDQVKLDRSSIIALDKKNSASIALIARENAVLAGLPIAKLVFESLNAAVDIDFLYRDGDAIKAGDLIAKFCGSATAILGAERTVLNFIQRLSGIATITASYVEAVKQFGTTIVDTRKTTPAWRLLEKYAVRCGGGDNHRFDLSDMIMFKDNHIALSGKSLTELVQTARLEYPKIPIACEADTLNQFKQLISLAPDIIMLDNMTLEEMTYAVANNTSKALLEATGGVTLATVVDIAATGVDRISIGALTHSVKAIDLAFDAL